MAIVVRPTRRDLLRLMGAAGVFLVGGPGCRGTSSGAVAAPPDAGTAGIFSDDERSALGALANAVIPPDAEPGGEALGAVVFIERLLTLFDGGAPQVFAGGPFSGRQPFADASGQATATFPSSDFASFIELDRVSAAVWKLKLLGSSGVSGGAPNDAILGPLVGLRDQVKTGLAAAMAAQTTPLAELSADDLLAAFDALDVGFRDLMIDLVTQAAFCAPEYGGNAGLAGWHLCHFEGDSLPLGYSQWNGTTYVERSDSPLSTANPGADPEPMDDETRQALTTAIAFLGGKTFP